MNIFIIFTFLFISFVYGKTKEIDQNIKIQESAQFLQNQLKKDGILDLATDKSKIDKEYISGMISLSIGTIGYFTTNSDTIKLAYSGVQSLGIISIGSSINRSLYPSLDKLYLDVANMKKNENETLPDIFLKNYALRDRAQRKSRMYTSGLLALQYASNALLDNPSSQIKKIYTFLFGVNVIIFSHSYFFQSVYEKEAIQLNLIVAKVNQQEIPGVALAWSW